MHPPTAHPRCLFLLLASLAACSSDSKTNSTLSAADFAKADAMTVGPPVVNLTAPDMAADLPPAEIPTTPNTPTSGPTSTHAGSTSKPLRPPTAADITGPVSASEGILDVAGSAGPPVVKTLGPAPQPVAIATLVDAKVGDVNGKPIYANAFLAPMADRLRAEARTKRFDEWRTEAKKSIDQALEILIEKELLRAEALAALTPEQKQGFFAFMNTVQQKLKSQNLGSREAASRQLEETEGKSLDEYMKEREQDELVTFTVNEKIKRRIHVSKRDVELEYQKFFDTFNPPPAATYRLVLIPTSDKDKIESFRAARAAGTPFAELAASDLNSYKPETGGLEERTLKTDRATATLFGAPELNKAAQTIEPGETAGPMTIGDNTAWLYLEKIETLKRTLYEAQTMIENVLRNQRERAAKDKYISQLKSRASMTSIPEMGKRLLAIAEMRFYPDRNAKPASK